MPPVPPLKILAKFIPPHLGLQMASKIESKIDPNFDVVFVSFRAPLGPLLGALLGPSWGLWGAQVGSSRLPKRVLDGFWAPTRVFSKIPRFPTRNHTFWPPGAPQDGPRAPRKGSKIDLRRSPKAFFFLIKIFIGFGTLLGPLLSSQEGPKSTPRGSQEGPEIEEKMMRFRSCAIIIARGPQEAPKRRPRGPQEAPKTPRRGSQEAPRCPGRLGQVRSKKPPR